MVLLIYIWKSFPCLCHEGI